MSEPCQGNGGTVFTYEGPQFGPQLIEEPCTLCGGWHESPDDRASRLRAEERRVRRTHLLHRVRDWWAK